MKANDLAILRVALDKKDEEPFTQNEMSVYLEAVSGEGYELMKISPDDERIPEYTAYNQRLEEKKQRVWDTRLAPAAAIAGISVSICPTSSYSRRHRIALAGIAAVITILAMVGVNLFFDQRSDINNYSNAVSKTTSAMPGRSKAALLQLSDSSWLNLDSIPVGTVITDGNSHITKQSSSRIRYATASKVITVPHVVKHQLLTPYGKEFKVTLADGSTIWLNAGSTLHYPANFDSTERRVEIKGEGYFEVEEKRSQPFVVIANSTEIKVLGTEFNVKAYPDERQVITLVKGSLNVQQGRRQQSILAGHQIIVDLNHLEPQPMSKEGIDEVLAWKSGLINLEGESVYSVMRQIQRWYNIEIRIDGQMPQMTLTGNFEKTVPLSQVLRLLNHSEDIHFHIDGKTLVASAKKK